MCVYVYNFKKLDYLSILKDFVVGKIPKTAAKKCSSIIPGTCEYDQITLMIMVCCMGSVGWFLTSHVLIKHYTLIPKLLSSVKPLPLAPEACRASTYLPQEVTDGPTSASCPFS